MWSTFLAGIACNLLVNVAILLGITAQDVIGKFLVSGFLLGALWLPVSAQHTNMYFLPAGMWLTKYFPGLANKMVDGAPE